MNKLKVYQIYMNPKNKIIIEYMPNFNDVFNWLNKTVHYDSDKRSYGIYCDENNIIRCQKKLIKELIKEQQDIIKDAEKKLFVLRGIEL